MFYKLLTLDDDGYLCSWGTWGTYRVMYKPGVWVEAHPRAAEQGYHLCVFDKGYFDKHLLHAKYLVGETYLCECMDEVELPQRCETFKLGDKGIFIPTRTNWPLGTRMFKKVKILEQVR